MQLDGDVKKKLCRTLTQNCVTEPWSSCKYKKVLTDKAASIAR